VIDTHAHLDHLANIDDALKNAVQAHVEHIITVGVDLASNKKNLELKKNFQHPAVHAAWGMHPGYYKVNEIDECLEFMRAHKKEAVAVGEIGLDFWYKDVRKDKEKHRQQRDLFAKQLDAAKEWKLPVIIHARGTWRECFESVKKRDIQKAVFHWYSGPVDVLKDIIAAGYFVSASPALAYSEHSRAAIAAAPIHQTLIETDCPVRYDQGDKEFFSEPKDVLRTLKAYAELKKMDETECCEILNANAQDFFPLNKK
jgi:TatD DNase family protein